MNKLENLWKGFKEGDHKAFSVLYGLYYTEMFKYGFKICSCKDLTEDSIHDVFVVLYESKERILAPKFLKYYLLKSLKNKIYAQMKKKKMELELLEINDFTGLIAENVESKVIKEEERDLEKNKLMLVLDSLTSKQEELLSLKFVSDYSYKEISRIIGGNHNSSRKQVYRVLKKVRDSFFY